MKTIFLLLFFTMIGATTQAQHLSLSPVAEQTVAGFQFGTRVLFQSSGQWGFGGFYQTSRSIMLEDKKVRDTFYGVLIQAPINRAEKVNVFLTARVGVVNEIFIVFVPGIETEIKCFPWLSVSVGTSMRMSHPSATAALYLKL
jgi:hypothetical protein